MTTAADDRATEQAFEASLAGRAVPGEAAGLAAFTSAVRGAATQPGRPSAALADLLSTGLLTDQSSPSTRTAPAAGPLPSRSARSRTRRRFTVIVPALIAKFLAAGAVAQAATGAGVVVVVVTGAGTAGVLPAATQETFDGLVGTNEAVEQPVQTSTDTEGEDLGGEEPLTDPTVLPPSSQEDVDDVELADAAAAKAWADNGPENSSQQAFKEWLAEGAENGWVNGQAVSRWAHERNEERKKAREAAREAARGAERQADEAEEAEADEAEIGDTDEQESEVESSDDDGDRSGKGKGQGKGKGNGKGRGGN